MDREPQRLRFPRLAIRPGSIRGLSLLWIPFPAALLLSGCVGEAEPYFADPAAAPEITSVINTDGEASPASEIGLRGGNPVSILGNRLKGDDLSVRFDGVEASLVTYDVETGRISVRTPPGPVRGGKVDVAVSHAGGVDILEDAYEYIVDDAAAFEHEAASLQLIGFGGGRFEAALAFWNGLHPRQVGSMLQTGALYYLPGELELPTAWPIDAPFPSWQGFGTVAIPDSVRLAPAGSSTAVPFTFVRDRLTDRYTLCAEKTPTWAPGASYRLDLAGGLLEEQVTLNLPSPPDINGGDPPEGLIIEDGVARINLDADLRLTFPPQPVPDADADYLLAELVVFAPQGSLPGQPLEVARIDVRGDEQRGGLEIAPEALVGLPEVNTTCALIGLQLESARARGEDDSALEQRYIDAGCGATDAPLAAYPFQGYLRLTRHYVHRVDNLPAGMLGCSTPGQCASGGELVVDLVAAWEIPASFLHLPVPECGNGRDDDEDGLADTDDPGCTSYLDETERDDTGLLLCDDGVDNDQDGLIDYSAGTDGDPGCDAVDDPSEYGEVDCDNGVDDDSDGVIDYRSSGGDPGCVDIVDASEHESDLSCDNGLDDDGDGYVDYRPSLGLGDPGCGGPEDSSEKDETGAWPCDDGRDNEGDGATDKDDAGCRATPGDSLSYSPYEKDEYNPIVQCDNSLDDDFDGLIDFRPNPQIAYGDPQCQNNGDNSEFKL